MSKGLSDHFCYKDHLSRKCGWALCKQTDEGDGFLTLIVWKAIALLENNIFFSCTLIDLATNVITFNTLEASFSLGTQKIAKDLFQ